MTLKQISCQQNKPIIITMFYMYLLTNIEQLNNINTINNTITKIRKRITKIMKLSM